MPPTLRKGKATARTTNPQLPSAQQYGIRAFAKISKAQSHAQLLGKRKAIDIEDRGSERCENLPKRQCQSIEEVATEGTPGSTSNVPTTASESSYHDRSAANFPQSNHGLPDSKQETPRKKAALQAVSAEAPTKGARSFLESFSLKSSSPSTRSSSPPLSHPSSPSTSPASSSSSSPTCEWDDKLPIELQDLVDLHSSFLSALSLHYAHYDCLAPVDLRQLNPSVSKIWRKRSVQVEDIQRIIGIAQSAQPKSVSGAGTFSLVDYGHGKVCLENVDDPNSVGQHKRPIEEEALHKLFEKKLRWQWQEYMGQKSDPALVGVFLRNLRLLPIAPCDSLAKLTPLLAKGQRRLEDLKAGAIKAQKSSFSIKSSPIKDVSFKRPKLTASRSDSLLSRIRAKELIQSTLPPPPSSAVVEKRSALQRIDEVAPVIGVLTTAGMARKSEPVNGLTNAKQRMQTQSFTMPTLVQHLQMSLRNPISKEDAARSVRLLAELVPEWVGLKEVGNCVGVTIRKGGAIDREVLGKRVEGMLQAL